MGNILVIGCVSLDTIHIEQKNSRETYKTIGGAGLFTALAAAKSGTRVTLYAPKPDPMPQNLSPIESILTWHGPLVEQAKMPTLEIIHHGGGRATLLGASWGPEQLLSVENLDQLMQTKIIADKQFDAVHVAALSTAARQLEFIEHWRKLGKGGLLSAGTYARAISSYKATVIDLIKQCDVFFMNSNEASLLSASQGNAHIENIVAAAGQNIFITDGEKGATILSQDFKDSAKHIDAIKAAELDPTGAGDTFCGATLAGLANGLSVTESARIGAALAAKVIEKPGSTYYF